MGAMGILIIIQARFLPAGSCGSTAMNNWPISCHSLIYRKDARVALDEA